MGSMRQRSDDDDVAYVIGRLLLAVADGDDDEARRCIRQYEEWGDVGSYRLVVDLATFGAGAAELLKGREWRTTVTAALHRLEIESLLRDPPDDEGGDPAGVPARI